MFIYFGRFPKRKIPELQEGLGIFHPFFKCEILARGRVNTPQPLRVLTRTHCDSSDMHSVSAAPLLPTTLTYTRRVVARKDHEGKDRTFRPVSTDPAATPPVDAFPKTVQSVAKEPVVVATAEGDTQTTPRLIVTLKRSASAVVGATDREWMHTPSTLPPSGGVKKPKRTPRRYASDNDNESEDEEQGEDGEIDNKSEDEEHGEDGENDNESDNEYQRKRLQNMALNHKVLQQLGLVKSKDTQIPKVKQKSKRVKKPKEVVYMRSSARVAQLPQPNYSEISTLSDARKRAHKVKRPASATPGSAAAAHDSAKSESEEEWEYEEDPRDKRPRNKRPRVTPEHTKEKGRNRCTLYRTRVGDLHIRQVLDTIRALKSYDALMSTCQDKKMQVDPQNVRTFIADILYDVRRMIPPTMTVPVESIWDVVQHTSLTTHKRENLIKKARELNIEEPQMTSLPPPPPRSMSAPVGYVPHTGNAPRARGPLYRPSSPQPQ